MVIADYFRKIPPWASFVVDVTILLSACRHEMNPRGPKRVGVGVPGDVILRSLPPSLQTQTSILPGENGAGVITLQTVRNWAPSMSRGSSQPGCMAGRGAPALAAGGLMEDIVSDLPPNEERP